MASQLSCGSTRPRQRRPGVEELVSGNPGSPEVCEAVVGHDPRARAIARLVVDLDQVGVVLDHAAGRVEVVGEEVAAGAVASRTPEEAAAVLLQDVAELAEDRQALHLPRVVVQALAAPGDPDAVMVRIAAEEEQGPVADVVGEPEAEDAFQELLGLPRVLALQHRVSELARLDTAAGVARLIGGHPDEDLEDGAVRTAEPGRLPDS